jgi:hypothetical protein
VPAERPTEIPPVESPQPTAVAAAPLLPIPPVPTLPASSKAAAVKTAVALPADHRTANPPQVCSVAGPPRPAASTSSDTTDQIKTVLALIGVIAVLYQGMRLLGSALG